MPWGNGKPWSELQGQASLQGGSGEDDQMRRALKVLAGLGGVAIAAALWWRKNPSACPYSQRFWVQAPHPFITRTRLLAALEPQPGERVLEIGPGTGYYSIDVAGRLMPEGTLEILDLQQEMLDHTMREARDAGLSNVVPLQGDAQKLPA